MKKLSIFLVAVLLIASLFVSCDNTTKAITDEHVKVTFSVDSGSRGLGYDIESILDSKLQWYYTAVKSDTNDPFTFGQVPLTRPESVTLGSPITFSQGLWDFTLFARRTDVADEPIVYSGASTNVLITNADSPVPIIVHVSPSTAGVNGTLTLNNVSINTYAGEGHVSSSVMANRAVIKNSEGKEIDTLNLSNGSYTGYVLPAGDYSVVVKYYNTNGNVENASEEIFITVWSGRTTTIRGNVDEITGTGTLNKYITEDTVNNRITSSSESAEFVAKVAPVNSENSAMKETTVSFDPSLLVETGTKDVSLQVSVKDIETAGNSFTVEGDDQSAVAGISLNLTVDGENKTGSFGDAVISTYIVKGLSDVNVKYNQNVSGLKQIYLIACGDNISSIPEGKDGYYNPTTGKLVFSTDHFSEYYVVSNSVTALNVTENIAYATLNRAINDARNGNTIKLLKNINEDVVIPKGKTVTLDLNDQVLTNSSNHTIVNNGNLTIIGTGTVDNIKHGMAALYNEIGATATLNGGVFTRSQEKGQSSSNNGGNSFYAILNHGRMTINDGVSVVLDGKYSSLLENGWQNGDGLTTDEEKNVTLTINGGTFDGGLNTIKNDDWGVLTINDGEFKNIAQHAVLNWNVATINGGNFTSNQYPIYGRSANKEMDQGKLIVTGGVFNYDSPCCGIYKRDDAAQITITGGEFSTQYISNASLAEGYYSEQNEDGKYEVKKATNWIQLADTSWYCSHKSCTHTDEEKSAPYTISSARELAGLALLVNNGIDTFSNKTIILGSDIDLFGFEWTPIGQKAGNKFAGEFDGNSKEISGLDIIETNDTAINTTPFDGYVGLFGAINGATIKDLTVLGSVKGSNAAGIVARMDRGLIDNCKSYVNVVGASKVADEGKAGGIVCCTNAGNGDCTIRNCFNYGSVSTTTEDDNEGFVAGTKGGVAGIVGYVNKNTSITSCKNYGSIGSLNDKYGAGIAGYVTIGGNIKISGCINEGPVTASLNAGGIVGCSTGVNSIESCSNNNSITASGSDGVAAGIAARTADTTITSCSNNGSVYGAKSGFIVGWTVGNTTIDNIPFVNPSQN